MFCSQQDEAPEERKKRREVYLLQRSLPVPMPSAVLHGPHTRLGPETTVSDNLKPNQQPHLTDTYSLFINMSRTFIHEIISIYFLMQVRFSQWFSRM